MNSTEHNPFQAPSAATSAQPLGVSLEKIHSVAKAQRLVNLAILFYLLFIGFNFITNISVSNENADSPLPFLILPLALGVLIFTMIAVGKLAHALHGTGNAVIYCLAMLIPCVGLILLFFLNSRASALLKQYGVKIGFLGADLRTLPSSQ